MTAMRFLLAAALTLSSVASAQTPSGDQQLKANSATVNFFDAPDFIEIPRPSLDGLYLSPRKRIACGIDLVRVRTDFADKLRASVVDL
jgi:hypothetical protein